jgi:hypothetical protein
MALDKKHIGQKLAKATTFNLLSGVNMGNPTKGGFEIANPTNPVVHSLPTTSKGGPTAKTIRNSIKNFKVGGKKTRLALQVLTLLIADTALEAGAQWTVDGYKMLKQYLGIDVDLSPTEVAESLLESFENGETSVGDVLQSFAGLGPEAVRTLLQRVQSELPYNVVSDVTALLVPDSLAANAALGSGPVDDIGALLKGVNAYTTVDDYHEKMNACKFVARFAGSSVNGAKLCEAINGLSQNDWNVYQQHRAEGRL